MPSSLQAKVRSSRSGFTAKTLSAAVVSAFLLANVHAAGLGRLTVLSSLGQPLVAEVELTAVSKDEIDALSAGLASPETFKQANVQYNNSVLNSLRFAVEQRGGRQFIRVTSVQPISEPFVDMLVELSGPNRRILREYTFLLDPADLRVAQPAKSPQPVPAVAASSAVSQPVTSKPVPAGSPTPPTRATSAPDEKSGKEKRLAGTEVEIQRGDTLAKIAARVRSSGVSLDQTLVALYQSNPDAFIGKNMNRLKAGKILSVPNEEVAGATSQKEAAAVVTAQAADFNAYRSRLASRIADSEARKSEASRQSATGSITAKVEDGVAPASDSKDKLKLSNSVALTNAPKSDSKAENFTAEDRIAVEKALSEANARVKELEKNVSDLQQLVELKNRNLAEQQTRAEAPKADVPNPVEPPKLSGTVPPSAPVESAPAVSAVPDSQAESAPPPVAEKPAAPQPMVEPTPVPNPAPEPSFLDQLSLNPIVLPGLGALLVLLGAFGVYSARRSKKRKQFEDSIITDSSLRANSLFGSTGGQSVDTNNSVFNSGFAPSASALDSNEVDPVAEADVYIAYGRDEQAEEILKEALRTQPNRNAVRVKLLEIYSNRRDVRAFEILATELHGLTKGEGDDWTQAAALGAALDPNNPLYADGKTSELVLPVAAAAPQENGLDALPLKSQFDSTPASASALETGNAYFTAASSDMNLRGDIPTSDSLVALPESPEPNNPVATPSNEAEFNLDELNFNSSETPAPGAASEPPAPLAAADLDSIDFNFLDEPVPGKAANEEPADTKAERIDEFDFLKPMDNAGLGIPEKSAAYAAPNDMSFSNEEFNPNVGQGTSGRAPELKSVPATDTVEQPADFDLSSISLELDTISGPATEPVFEGGELELPPLETETSFGDAEMDTKLDLAIAYQEIGDKEGARELLDEVMKGGTPEQIEKAKSLLMELA